MKSSLGVSLTIHALVLIALGLSSGLTIGKEPRAVIYQVNLIELQPEPPAPDPTPAVEPERTPEPPKPEPPKPVPPKETPAPAMPTRVPDLEVRNGRTRDIEMATPSKPLEERELDIEAPERQRRPQPSAEPVTPPVEPAPEAPAEPETPRPRGASTQLASESPIFTQYAYYRVAMRNKIAAAWSPPRASSELVCVVEFRIVRSGAVINARIVESSGLTFFDSTALRAVNGASPLPSLPADFPDDVVNVSFEFAYTP